jgi:predicted N-acetyltransferase YhbS
MVGEPATGSRASMQHMVDPASYPHELVEVAYLRDGTAVEFRPVRPDDEARFERLFHRLSPLTLYRRFFSPVHRINRRLLAHLVNVDYTDRLAIVAQVDDEVVAVGRFDRITGTDEAEIAITVEDAWQGRGLGTRLLWRLSAAARERGIAAFVATVQGENRPMMGLLQVIGTPVETQLVGGEYEVRIELAGMPSP